jgi:nicotinate phosphoribosyltransferase
MVTGKPDASLDGVYKLVSLEGQPKMKFSESIEKTTLPGKKQLVRYFDEDRMFYRDAILLDDELPENIDLIYHPIHPEMHTSVKGLKGEILLHEVLSNGKVLVNKQPLQKIHAYLSQRAQLLSEEHKRIIRPHIYKVGISQKLLELRKELSEKYNH